MVHALAGSSTLPSAAAGFRPSGSRFLPFRPEVRSVIRDCIRAEVYLDGAGWNGGPAHPPRARHRSKLPLLRCRLALSRAIPPSRPTTKPSTSSASSTGNVERFVETYNGEVQRWSRRKSKVNIDDFLLTDEKKIKWSSRLKQLVESGVYAEFNPARIRTSVYRPYCIQSLYFDSVLMHRRGRLAEFFPTAADGENTVTWVKVGTEWPSFAVASSKIPDLLPAGGSQCFPFYTYAEDGTNRRENITDWALEQFRSHYGDPFITKWDIFHYVYAVLHHPEYRQRYAANLRRELPRIPFVGTSGAKAPVEGDADAAINGRSSTNADASINGNSSTEAQSSGNATVEERPFRAAHNDPIPALSSRAQPNDSRANHSAESRDPAPAGSGHKPGKEFSPQPPLGAARDQNSPARQAKGQAAARSFDSVAGRASAPGHSAQDDRVGRVRDADVFWEFVRAGRRLAEIHVHYEQQLEYPLTRTEKAARKTRLPRRENEAE